MSTQWEALENYLYLGDGYFRLTEVLELGFTRSYVHRFIAKQGDDLIKVHAGLYRLREYFPDLHYEATYACPRAVFSHDTGINLHDWPVPPIGPYTLADIPTPLTVTVPRGYNTSRLRARGLHVVTAAPERWAKDQVTVLTPWNREVRAYTRERCEADLTTRPGQHRKT